MRRSTVAVGCAVAVLSASVLVSLATGASEVACPAGTVKALIGGKRVCLKAGQKCAPRYNARYHKYGFDCSVGARLTRRRPKPPPPPKSVSIAISGQEERVFDWASDRCNDEDIPDLPARAYRDADGNVHLIAPHYRAIPFVGATLDTVKRECKVVLDSHHNPDPAAFDDREWLASVYTLDGRNVVGFVEDEYWGSTHPGQCPSGDFNRCWYSTITTADSTDGGNSFTHATPPGHFFAQIPARYVPDSGRRGIAVPSTIVRNPADGYYYLALQVNDSSGRYPGVLLRTRTPDKPGSWGAWDGTGFNAHFANPYAPLGGAAPQPPPVLDLPNLCAASFRYVPDARQFICVGTAGGPAGGIAFVTSPDLRIWSTQRVILPGTETGSYVCGGPEPTMYYSLIDPDSPSRNFETVVGKTAYVYYTRFHYTNCQMTLDRDLVRIPISVTVG